MLKKAPRNIRFSEELRGTKEELLQLPRQFQLEGLVAKRPDSLYEAGRRSGATLYLNRQRVKAAASARYFRNKIA